MSTRIGEAAGTLHSHRWLSGPDDRLKVRASVSLPSALIVSASDLKNRQSVGGNLQHPNRGGLGAPGRRCVSIPAGGWPPARAAEHHPSPHGPSELRSRPPSLDGGQNGGDLDGAGWAVRRILSQAVPTKPAERSLQRRRARPSRLPKNDPLGCSIPLRSPIEQQLVQNRAELPDVRALVRAAVPSPFRGPCSAACLRGPSCRPPRWPGRSRREPDDRRPSEGHSEASRRGE